jgi:transcriptional regulator with XRE-family HTH domain
MMHDMHLNVNAGIARGAFARTMHHVHDLAMNLRRIREAKGLNQRDLAEMVGVDQSTIQRAEKMASTAKLATYQRCADVLGVTLSDLFAEDRTPVEAALLAAFRQVPESKQGKVFDLLELAREENPKTASGNDQADGR